MTRLQKSAASLGVFALAAGTLAILTPRAAHAVAAALVQVTNTAANPAMAQDVNGQAAQQVDLVCQTITPGTPVSCQTESGAAVFGAAYTVPANQTLVVTAVDMQPYYTSVPSQCNAGTGISLTTNGTIRKSWFVMGIATVHFAYPSGFLLSGGQAIGEVSNQFSACPASLEMHGYLTSN